MKSSEWISKAFAAALAVIAIAGLVVAVSSMSTSSDPGGVSNAIAGRFIMAGLAVLIVATFSAVWIGTKSVAKAGWATAALIVCCALAIMIVPAFKQRQAQKIDASYSRDYTALTALVDQAHSDLRAAVDTQAAAASVPQEHAARIRATEFEVIYPSAEDGYFLEQHAIFMFVMFKHETPAFTEIVGHSYVNAYCTRFHENFGELVIDGERRDRAASLCPNRF